MLIALQAQAEGVIGLERGFDTLLAVGGLDVADDVATVVHQRRAPHQGQDDLLIRGPGLHQWRRVRHHGNLAEDVHDANVARLEQLLVCQVLSDQLVIADDLHHLTDGDVIVIESAWAKLNGRPARVIDSDTGEFAAEGSDTTSVKNYSAGSGAGKVREASGWTQISQITEPAANGGEQQFLTYSFLEDDDDRQLPTTKSASSMTLPVAVDPSQAYVAIVEAADEDKEPRLILANLPGGATIYYYAYVSITATPTLSRNNIMTRTITLSFASRPTRYNA